jgi:peptidyl-prolyl cis-trans isomerase SurA
MLNKCTSSDAMKFKRTILCVLIPLLGIGIYGCGAGGQDNIVAKIGNTNLPLSEYEKQYVKNNGGKKAADTASYETRKDFLNLLVKYRLKVLEAYDKKYDQDTAIQRELSEYRNNLALPYLTERALMDPKIEDLWKRRQEEVHVAHILIRPAMDTTGVPDTLRASEKANAVLKRALAGENFDSLAARNSDDQGTAKQGGDLGYFLAGMTVPAFDEACYSLQPGQIYPRPVKTMFGYHLIKMIERHKSRGEIHVSHILVRIPQDSLKDTTAAYARIKGIYDSLSTKKATFEELARRSSDDPQSGAAGGDLGWVGRRKFVPEFELPAFKLAVGTTSGIVRTAFGYHIIRVNDERPAKSFEDSKQELKDIYRRYSFDEDNKQFLAQIERKFSLTVDHGTFNKLVASVDSTSTTSTPNWSKNVSNELKRAPLLTLLGKTVTVDDAILSIEKNRDLQSKALNTKSLTDVVAMVGQKEALQMETADLEQRYPEFADLMQEYKEGVLLFRAEQDAVWNRVTVDETALRAYWSDHKSEYRWKDRVSFSEIFVSNDSVAKVMRDSLNAGIDFGELAERNTIRNGYKEKKGDWGFQEESANDLSRRAMTAQVGWVEGPVKFQYGSSVIKVTGKEKAREKTFEEAQSEVSSKYQEYESRRLEREWIEGLKTKFGVVIHEEVLRQAFSR